MQCKRVLSLPSAIHADENRVPQVHHLIRDATGGVWALGDQEVLFSRDGANWTDFSLNLKSAGSFTVYSVLRKEADILLISRNRDGVSAYRLDEWERRWIFQSTIESRFPPVACSVLDKVVVLSLCKGGVLIYRSEGVAQAWTEAPFEITTKSVPVAVNFSASGKGLCCFRNLFDEREPNKEESSLYSTSDYGCSWRQVATINAMVLSASPLEDGGLVLGGTNGQLCVCSPDQKPTPFYSHSNDIVAVDSFRGTVLALTESAGEPIMHTLIRSDNGREWGTHELQIPGRVHGVKLISDNEVLIATTRELYLCGSARRELGRWPTQASFA